MKISARTLVGYSTDQLWEMLTGRFVLVFDDGEIETDYKEVVYSSYMWEVHRQVMRGELGLKRAYPDVPMFTSHHVQSVLNGKQLGSGTHLKLLGNVLWSIYDWLCHEYDEEEKLALRYRLAELSYQITNRAYNDLQERLEEYVTSLDIVDFIAAAENPMVVEAYEKIEPTPKAINEVYSAISTSLAKSPLNDNNPLAKLFRAGLASEKQVQQCLGPRGYITDIDSVIFPRPVLYGYLDGIYAFHDSAIESRSAAKSLMFSKDQLQATEYFSRRLQLVSMAVKNLHHCDCGSTKFLDWHVRGVEERDGEITYGGDLKQLAGKVYVDDKGKLAIIKATDKHLVGQKIKLRSVMGCRHPDPSGVCSVCFGQLSEVIPPKSNLGHMCSTYMSQQSSQGVLSTKHLDGSSTVEAIELSDSDRLLLKVAQDGNSYMLADNLKNKKVKLVIPGDRAINITDVYEVSEIDQLTISRVSELIEIGIQVNNGKIVTEQAVAVHVNKRYSSMTHDLLQHIKDKGWTTDERGNMIVDMAGWNFSKSILALPMKHFSMSDHSKDIAEMLESSMKEVMNRDRFVYPSALLVDLFTLVNSRLSVNLAVLEVTLYAAMVVSASGYDYSLPKPWTTQGLGVMRNTMNYRSLSAQMSFEYHHKALVSPHNYMLKNRPDHLFDMVLMPREVSSIYGTLQAQLQ